MKTQPAHIHLALHFQIVVVKRAQSINYSEINFFSRQMAFDFNEDVAYIYIVYRIITHNFRRIYILDNDLFCGEAIL